MPPELDAVFHALAHGARRQMLSRLAASELTVGELAEPLAMSLAAASKHVKALERAGLVRRSVEGRRHVCRLEPGPLAAATRLAALPRGRLDTSGWTRWRPCSARAPSPSRRAASPRRPGRCAAPPAEGVAVRAGGAGPQPG